MRPSFAFTRRLAGGMGRAFVFAGVVAGLGVAGCSASTPPPGWIGVLTRYRATDLVPTVLVAPWWGSGSRAGLREGDQLLTIDGVSTRSMTAIELWRSLHGPIGSCVVVEVRRGCEQFEIVVKREPLKD